ncbi:hypothetical protein GGR56DRAFT_622078 [Xylariaceae sp. FL0804]|nr:hypothetical protein GGR56DRAFT_622078 [Xylariaceae sp. FL0804]
METYNQAQEIRIYEDRIKHVNGFRDFMANYNERPMGLRGPATRPPGLWASVHLGRDETAPRPAEPRWRGSRCSKGCDSSAAHGVEPRTLLHLSNFFSPLFPMYASLSPTHTRARSSPAISLGVRDL